MKDKVVKTKLDIGVAIVEWVRLLVFAIILAYVNSTFLFRSEQVVGKSMLPTLESEERVISNVISPLLFGIDRFDVVVVKDIESGTLWVKRVIGLPNEQIAYKNGILYIDGEAMEELFLDESFIEELGFTPSTFTNDMDTYTLQEDEYFLVGDNRPTSLDSRVRGAFHRNDIISKDAYIFWPFEKARMVTNGSK